MCPHQILMNKIFISIAAYEDLCLAPTITDAIQKAKFPDRLVFGVGLQYESPPDLSFVPNLKLLTYESGNHRPGVVRVRYDLSQLVTDEKYFLQIDAHSRFMQDWDTELEYLLMTCKAMSGNLDVVLSGNPSSVVGNNVHNTEEESRTRCFRKFAIDNSREGFAEQLSNVADHFDKNNTNTFNKVYHISAGYIFCSTRMLKEVGLDPYSRSMKEEAYMSWRLLISGWDIYQPRWSMPVGHDEDWQRELNGDWIWKQEHRFNGTKYHDWIAPATVYMMSLAMIFNDYSYYAIKNAKRTPAEVWKMAGIEDTYLEYKAIHEASMHNNLMI